MPSPAALSPFVARRGSLRPPLLGEAHLDIRVDDVDVAERAVPGLGAGVLEGGAGTGFRVYADPAGHPFCLVH